jgi:hypothetical protein
VIKCALPGCDVQFKPGKPWQNYCSPAHRLVAFRKAKKGEGAAAAPADAPREVPVADSLATPLEPPTVATPLEHALRSALALVLAGRMPDEVVKGLRAELDAAYPPASMEEHPAELPAPGDAVEHLAELDAPPPLPAPVAEPPSALTLQDRLRAVIAGESG